MTRETFEMVKESIKEELPKLKRDYRRLNDIINIFDDFLKKGTPENIDDYCKHMDNIMDSLEVLDL